MKKQKTFLIWGANFKNKGAQAMLFTTVSELRSRFPECKIFYNTWEEEQAGFQFKKVWYGRKKLDLLQKNPVYWYAKSLALLMVKRRKDVLGYFRLRKQFKEIDALVDVSGFALSSQFGYDWSDVYLRIIETAKMYHIPVFLMPQSFGPFDYGDRQAEMDQRLASTLSYPVTIFAREISGYRTLTEKYELKNVLKSVDLVLQNKYIDQTLIMSESENLYFHSTNLDTRRNVAIIPNMRTIDRGGANHDRMISLYKKMIRELVSKGFYVYLVRHSGEDLEVCEDIWKALEDHTNIFRCVDDYNCVEFNSLLQNFDFIIASRYHSIIHAYKNGVPAVVLGWAEKYLELLKMFEQEEYMFDVRNFHDQLEVNILNAVRKMGREFSTESAVIRNTLPKYQEENCFDTITDYFQEKEGGKQ